MRFSLLAASTSLSVIFGLNILVTNDDGFGTGNIREMYKAIKAYGHNVYIVASTKDNSRTGGTVSLTMSANLTADTEFGIVKAGAPSIGTDPNDSHIWYYNGTPSACVQVAFDYIFPTFTNITNGTPDLVLSGPKYGDNVGDFVYTRSGTIGATYFAIGRGIPAIAYSANYSYGVGIPYYQVNATTPAGLKDPATIAGELAANLAQHLIVKAGTGRVLPLGYGLNVNFPYITSQVDTSCVNPPFIQSRMTGGAYSYGVKFNATTGLFKNELVYNTPALNVCINGDCSLPGEASFLDKDCKTSVSVFTVDYDAPDSSSCAAGNQTAAIRSALGPLVQYANSSVLVGGLNGTTSVFGNSTATKTMSATGSATSAVFTGAAVVHALSYFALVPALLGSMIFL